MKNPSYWPRESFHKKIFGNTQVLYLRWVRLIYKYFPFKRHFHKLDASDIYKTFNVTKQYDFINRYIEKKINQVYIIV